MHGHITSLAVARTHRKLGLATRLMTAARELISPLRLFVPLLLLLHKSELYKSLSGGSVPRQRRFSLNRISRHAAAHAQEAPTVKCEPTRADQAMADVFDAEYVSLHVRVTNKGAFHLYTQTLGYECAPSRPCILLLFPSLGGQYHAQPLRCRGCCSPKAHCTKALACKGRHNRADTIRSCSCAQHT